MYHGFPKRLQQWPCLLKPLSTCDRFGWDECVGYVWMNVVKVLWRFRYESWVCTVYSSWSYDMLSSKKTVIQYTFEKGYLDHWICNAAPQGGWSFWLLTWVDSVAVWHPHLQGCFGSQGSKCATWTLYTGCIRHWAEHPHGSPNFFCSSCTCAWAVSTFRWVALVRWHW